MYGLNGKYHNFSDTLQYVWIILMCCFETLQIVSSTVGYVYSAVLDVGIGRAVLCCYVHVPH